VLESELAERLISLIPCAEMARFGKSGSDATTAAVRLARAYTGREHVIMCGYHGWHDWSIGHAETEANRAGVPQAVRLLTTSVGRGDRHFAGGGDVAAIVLDCSKIDRECAAHWRHVASQTGALLIFDEVITGFRWALGGAQAAYGVTPDLACFSKAMANGMPISAVVGSADIMQMFDHVFFSGTFFGETLSIAAACATIEKIENEEVCCVLRSTGQRMAGIAQDEIRARGLDRHIWFDGHPAYLQIYFSSPAVREVFLTAMLAKGVLLNTAHNVCFAHNDEDMETVLNAYRAAMDEVERVAETKAA
jgi:glutamate-1-semialdehyde aminotransferase